MMDHQSEPLLPASRWARWLAGSALDVPAALRARLLHTYLTSVASLVSGTLANLIVNVVATIRHPALVFDIMLALDIVLIGVRVGLLVALRRAAAAGTRGPTDLFIVSSIAWAGLLGTGTCVCFVSGDIVLQVLAPVTMVAMVGGVATRNYGLPRLALLQIIAMDAPFTLGAMAFRQEPWFLTLAVQFPLYVVSMGSTVFRLHRAYLTVAIAERENERRATHDALTGLWNRPGLMEALKRNLSRSNRHEEHFALFYVDLDGFKAVNDGLGHAAGDRLLQLVATRLEEAMPPDSIVARLGGDEFVALVPGVARTVAEALGRKAIEVGSQPYDLGEGPPVSIGISIGLACAEPGLSADDLLARADAALYRAKAAGKGRLVASGAADAAAREERQRAA